MVNIVVVRIKKVYNRAALPNYVQMDEKQTTKIAKPINYITPHCITCRNDNNSGTAVYGGDIKFSLFMLHQMITLEHDCSIGSSTHSIQYSDST